MNTPVASAYLNNNTSYDKSNNNVSMKLDSGATKHFFRRDHLRFLTNITRLSSGPTATLPNGQVVTATHEGIIKMNNNLSQAALKVLVFPHLTNESLILIGQLCDDGCIVLFTKSRAFICKNEKLIGKGVKNRTDGLWDLNATSITQQSMKINMSKLNYIVRKDKTKHDLASYYHASLFSLAISTLMIAIKKSKLDQLAWHRSVKLRINFENDNRHRNGAS